MRKVTYITIPLMIFLSFTFFSFKGIYKKIPQDPKIKIFYLTEDVKIKMIWVSPGTYLMGSPVFEIGRTPEREKQHEVTINDGFWLAETEFTQDQWERIMGHNPSFNKDSNLPVDQVSFLDIQKLLLKINGKGNEFRLPTETEWEYACRAGSKEAYATNNFDEMVWHSGNSGKQSHPVAKKNPNAWGFYDMQGNILEWCSDWFVEDNTGKRIGSLEQNGTYRVQRGGQFTGRTKHTRAADRQRGLPDGRDFFVGFRLAHNGTNN